MSEKFELFREGQETEDGRYIEVGAVELPRERIPLLALPTNDGEHGALQVGWIENVHREGSRAYGDVEVTAEGVDVGAITVDIASAVFFHNEEKDRIVLKAGRLMSGVANTKDNYPWKGE